MMPAGLDRDPGRRAARLVATLGLCVGGICLLAGAAVYLGAAPNVLPATWAEAGLPAAAKDLTLAAVAVLGTILVSVGAVFALLERTGVLAAVTATCHGMDALEPRHDLPAPESRRGEAAPADVDYDEGALAISQVALADAQVALADAQAADAAAQEAWRAAEFAHAAADLAQATANGNEAALLAAEAAFLEVQSMLQAVQGETAATLDAAQRAQASADVAQATANGNRVGLEAADDVFRDVRDRLAAVLAELAAIREASEDN